MFSVSEIYYRSVKDLEGDGHGIVGVLSWHLPGRIQENYDKHQEG
jgi:hypothetical protein